MSRMKYNWTSVQRSTLMFPSLEDLSISFNLVSRLDTPSGDSNMNGITSLTLEGNLLSSWDEILKLGALPRQVYRGKNSVKKMIVLEIINCWMWSTGSNIWIWIQTVLKLLDFRATRIREKRICSRDYASCIYLTTPLLRCDKMFTFGSRVELTGHCQQSSSILSVAFGQRIGETGQSRGFEVSRQSGIERRQRRDCEAIDNSENSEIEVPERSGDWLQWAKGCRVRLP